MDLDLTLYFEKYEALVAKADAAFERVRDAYAECVKCREKCADCCHALFDLTLIEALYIHSKFNQKVKGAQKVKLLEKANRADRMIHRIKRKAYNDLRAGKSEERILAELGLERVRCPLLNERDLCDLYEYRPITCRFYGIPTDIGGSGHTCGFSGFKKGRKYPTVHLDAVHNRLQEISAQLLRDIESRNIKLTDLLVPLSMALLSDYDNAYLGVGEQKPEDEEPIRPQKRRKR
jgi:Fe-S-cluster containining protein